MAKVAHRSGEDCEAEKQILRRGPTVPARWNSKVRKLDKVSTRLHTASAKTFRIWAFVARLCSPPEKGETKSTLKKHSPLFFDNPFLLWTTKLPIFLLRATEIEDLPTRLIFAPYQKRQLGKSFPRAFSRSWNDPISSQNESETSNSTASPKVGEILIRDEIQLCKLFS